MSIFDGICHIHSGNSDRLAKVTALIARSMGPTWGPPGAYMTQVEPMLAQWSLLSGCISILGDGILWYGNWTHADWPLLEMALHFQVFRDNHAWSIESIKILPLSCLQYCIILDSNISRVCSETFSCSIASSGWQTNITLHIYGPL